MAKRGKNKVTRSMINQEITRIRNIVREAEKQGYIFGDVIPKNVNVTKSQLSKLRSVTREHLLSTARRKDQYGQFLPTQAERDIEKRKKVKEQKQKYQQEKREIRQKRKERRLRQTPTKYTHSQTTSYYPTLSIIDVIRDKINSLPNARGFFKRKYGYFYVDFETRKNALESILDDSIANATSLQGLEQYYVENQSRIIELLEITAYDSDGDKVEASFVELAILLKGSPLTMEEAQEISDMSEMVNGF